MPVRQTTSVDDVFINCPFDRQYTPLFRALLFCVHACEFRPRSARELDDSGQLRMEKLFSLIEACRYGIHDLSRTELDPDSQLPRFNMPLELGIFLGARRFGNKGQKQKRTLVLDVEQFRYQRFISDLAGMDIHAHAGDPEIAVERTRNWLANVSRRQLPSAARLQRLYRQFTAELPAICDNMEFDVQEIPYLDFESMIVTWLLEGPTL